MKMHAEFLDKIKQLCNDKAQEAKAKEEKCGNDFLERQYQIGRRHAALDIAHEIDLLKLSDDENAKLKRFLTEAYEIINYADSNTTVEECSPELQQWFEDNCDTRPLIEKQPWLFEKT
jgi:hypothetical protein